MYRPEAWAHANLFSSCPPTQARISEAEAERDAAVAAARTQVEAVAREVADAEATVARERARCGGMALVQASLCGCDWVGSAVATAVTASLDAPRSHDAELARLREAHAAEMSRAQRSAEKRRAAVARDAEAERERAAAAERGRCGLGRTSTARADQAGGRGGDPLAVFNACRREAEDALVAKDRSAERLKGSAERHRASAARAKESADRHRAKARGCACATACFDEGASCDCIWLAAACGHRLSVPLAGGAARVRAAPRLSGPRRRRGAGGGEGRGGHVVEGEAGGGGQGCR